MTSGGDDVYSTVSELAEGDDHSDDLAHDVTRLQEELRAAGDQLEHANDSGRRLRTRLGEADEQIQALNKQTARLHRQLEEAAEREKASMSDRVAADGDLQLQLHRATQAELQMAEMAQEIDHLRTQLAHAQHQAQATARLSPALPVVHQQGPLQGVDPGDPPQQMRQPTQQGGTHGDRGWNHQAAQGTIPKVPQQQRSWIPPDPTGGVQGYPQQQASPLQQAMLHDVKQLTGTSAKGVGPVSRRPAKRSSRQPRRWCDTHGECAHETKDCKGIESSRVPNTQQGARGRGPNRGARGRSGRGGRAGSSPAGAAGPAAQGRSDGQEKPAKPKKPRSCFVCGEEGHIAVGCPKKFTKNVLAKATSGLMWSSRSVRSVAVWTT